jgi:acyl phosphate:glycerol-3-phosphate acyltransferase
VSTTSSALRVVAATLTGYLLGTVPSADLATRLAGSTRSLRDEGSGNPGALNAAAVLGTRWGVAVLSADMAKGAAAGGLGRAIGGDAGAYAAATAAIAGHIAPVWNGFRGGKGVATSAGACLAVFPVYFPIDAAVAAATAVASQRAERSIQVSCAAWTLAAVVWWRRGLPNGWGPAPGPGLAAFAAGSSAMILARFRAARTANR